MKDIKCSNIVPRFTRDWVGFIWEEHSLALGDLEDGVYVRGQLSFTSKEHHETHGCKARPMPCRHLLKDLDMGSYALFLQ